MRVLKRIPPLLLALMLPASSLAQSAAAGAPATPQDSSNACPAKSLLFDFDYYREGSLAAQLPVWRLRDDSAFFFSAGMAIDADGAPNAYNADNTGLDDLSNAGEPGHWEGVLQDQDGNPLVQGPDDPFPGYYISCTALADWTKDRFDPTRFIDASKIPYIALPPDLARSTGARLGDLAAVFNLRNGKYSYAIFADIGALGEGSIALADNLGIWSDARRGGSRGGMVYLVFPGSGNHRPKSVEEIGELGGNLLQQWGGAEQMIHACGDYGSWARDPWSTWPVPSRPESDSSQPAKTSDFESKPAATPGAPVTNNATSN